jgi:hypothetical protein
VTFGLVPVHGCRLLALRPAGGAPALAGTTAHVGMGWLDITGHAWDEASGVLRVTVEPVGRRRRSVFFDPAGRAVQGATFDGREVPWRAQGAGIRVELEVSQRGMLELRFE